MITIHIHIPQKLNVAINNNKSRLLRFGEDKDGLYTFIAISVGKDVGGVYIYVDIVGFFVDSRKLGHVFGDSECDNIDDNVGMHVIGYVFGIIDGADKDDVGADKNVGDEIGVVGDDGDDGDDSDDDDDGDNSDGKKINSDGDNERGDNDSDGDDKLN